MFRDFFFLALSNLKHRGIRSWLTMLGIFIGIAAVVSLISLGEGLQTAITGQFSSLSTDKLTIQNSGTGFGAPGSTAIRKLTDHDLNIISSVNGVDRAIGRLIRIAKVEYNKAAQFSYIGSLPNDKSDADFVYSSLNIEPKEGKLLQPTDKGKVILGNDFTNENMFGKKLRVGSKITIQGKEFQVAGILKKSSSFQINFVILMIDDDMRSLLNIPKGETDIIVAQVHSEKIVEQTAKAIEEKLRKDRKEKAGEEDFNVQTPIQALSAVSTILNIINLIVGGIASISLIIGGVGITNTMYTSVLERTKEIGAMKAVGAQNKDILLIFLIESGLLGLLGGIIGVIIGLGMAFTAATGASIALGTELFKVHLSAPLILLSLLFSSLVGIFAGIIPAYQASRLNPVEALRA